MLLGHRLLLLGVLALPAFSGCGSMSHGSESGTIAQATGGSMPTPPVTPPKAGPAGGGASGTHNQVSATASVDVLAVAIGASQTITVTFTSNDGLPISGFSVYGSSGTLPAGWSAPTNLTCAVVAPGSGCVLSLTYAPAAIETGTLTLDCVYVDNAGLPRTPGPCMTIAYAATASNHVVASISPSGEIDAAVGGGKQSVVVNFITDDGNAATAFALSTNLGALPSGWSSKAAGLNCAVVSTGNGCQLALVFAPSAATAGTLTLNYDYTDGSGAAQSGALNIPYAVTSQQTVVASVSPNGQINAAQPGGQQSVAVTFTTDDGNAASGLSLTSNLTKLPAGWSSTSAAFGCASVSTGNGCQLQLKFAPTTLGAGTLTLRYSYNDAGGAPNFGLLTVPYAATTNDNVVGTAAPSGQIVAMLGSPTQAVSIAFTTDDNRLATALQLTSNLAALPPGWSSTAGSFACSVLGTGSACQLMLNYAPTGVDNGTLMLNYAYVNNADEAKTGSVAIDYRTTTNDNVLAAVNPTSLSVVTGSGSNPVMVTFTTDDGNVASSLSADLTALPADWSSTSSTFTCATVSIGASCQVSLNYSPTVGASSTLAFGYSYVNSAGTTQTGTVSIPYTAAP
jgi:hypothetical protein